MMKMMCAKFDQLAKIASNFHSRSRRQLSTRHQLVEQFIACVFRMRRVGVRTWFAVGRGAFETRLEKRRRRCPLHKIRTCTHNSGSTARRLRTHVARACVSVRLCLVFRTRTRKRSPSEVFLFWRSSWQKFWCTTFFTCTRAAPQADVVCVRNICTFAKLIARRASEWEWYCGIYAVRRLTRQGVCRLIIRTNISIRVCVYTLFA